MSTTDLYNRLMSFVREFDRANQEGTTAEVVECGIDIRDAILELNAHLQAGARLPELWRASAYHEPKSPVAKKVPPTEAQLQAAYMAGRPYAYLPDDALKAIIEAGTS